MPKGTFSETIRMIENLKLSMFLKQTLSNAFKYFILNVAILYYNLHTTQTSIIFQCRSRNHSIGVNCKVCERRTKSQSLKKTQDNIP